MSKWQKIDMPVSVKVARMVEKWNGKTYEVGGYIDKWMRLAVQDAILRLNSVCALDFFCAYKGYSDTRFIWKENNKYAKGIVVYFFERPLNPCVFGNNERSSSFRVFSTGGTVSQASICLAVNRGKRGYYYCDTNEANDGVRVSEIRYYLMRELGIAAGLTGDIRKPTITSEHAPEIWDGDYFPNDKKALRDIFRDIYCGGGNDNKKSIWSNMLNRLERLVCGGFVQRYG